MELEIIRNVPAYWTRNLHVSNYNVQRHTNEFTEIEDYFTGGSVCKIERVENVIRYGLFMVRQQHLLALSPTTTYYKVRRFANIPIGKVQRALEFHLDDRRLDGERIQFSNTVQNVGSGNAVFVITVVTNQPFSTYFQPSRDSDYYIEYVVYFNN